MEQCNQLQSVPSANSAESRLNPISARFTILIVEDHDDTRYLYKYVLESDGYHVLESTDGLEAVEIACNEQPDLILIDGNLPSLDGLSATRRIRQQFPISTVPIILLSGHSTPDFQAQALAAGCNASLIKPVALDILVERVKKLLPQYPTVA